MGVCFSCCRRKRTGEKEPLLPLHKTAEDVQLSHDRIQKIAQVLAALSASKLPSQEQINQASRVFLKSGILNAAGDSGYGPLSERGREVLRDVEEVAQAIMQFGLEKNDDDVIQDLWYQSGSIPDTPIDIAVDVSLNPQLKLDNSFARLPEMLSENEINADTQRAISALRTLSTLFLTRTSFRLLLSDALLTARSVLSDVAVDLAKVASLVENGALQVDELVRPPSGASEVKGMDEFDTEAVKGKGREVVSGVGGIVDETVKDAKRREARSWTSLEESPDRIKGAFLERVKQIIIQAQENPAYKTSLTTLFGLLRKYVEQATTLAAATQEAAEVAAQDSYQSSSASIKFAVQSDPHLDKVLADLKTLIQRLSGHSIDTLVSKFHQVLRDMNVNQDGLQEYFSDIDDWVYLALDRPGWISSKEAARRADRLYDRGRSLTFLNPRMKADVRVVIDLLDELLDNIQNDRTTGRLFSAIERLAKHTQTFGAVGANVVIGQREALTEARNELFSDVVQWLVPRILRSLKSIPIPRFEFKSNDVDAVVDNVLIRSPSLVPDRVVLQTYNKLDLSASAGLPGGSTSTVDSRIRIDSATHVHIEGLRVSAESIAYFVHAKNLLLGFGWRDNGLLSIDIGGQGVQGDGARVDIDLEAVDDSDGAQSFYKVKDVQVDVPGLRFTIAKSHHWILNSLVQPFIGPMGRRIVGTIVAAQIKSLLEELDTKLYRIHRKAKDLEDGEGVPAAATYWDAVKTLQAEDQRRGDQAAEEERKRADREGEEVPTTETETHATLKGVVHTIHTEATEDAPAQETALAFGIGEQILPDLAGPAGEDNALPTLAEQGREVLNEAQGKVDEIGRGVRENVDGVQGSAELLKQDLADGGDTLEARKRMEEKAKGWRSDAFDF